jgi:hypothetical protein
MYASYGSAIRDYAFAVSSGRLQAGQLDANYLGKCINAITNCGNDNLRWSQENAYGSSLPDATKRSRSGGWYYSTLQAFDLVVARQFNPDPAYVDAILRNLNYEAGCNPVNMTYITGLGWRRARDVVDQYSANDRRVLPKTGIPISNIQEGFYNTWTYGYELAGLCYPSDGVQTAPYPFYDRWGDSWNVSTEASTAGTVRSFAVTAWVAAQTTLATQSWRSTNATMIVPTNPFPVGQPVTVTLQVPNLGPARIVWDARDQEPTFGGLTYTFTPSSHVGAHWIEAEVQWPDGRRAFAMNSITVSLTAPPGLSAPRILPGGGFSFQLAGTPQAAYTVEASTNLTTWDAIVTITLPASGILQISDPAAGTLSRRYYRAVRSP